jgi:transcriptional regulator with XRE-family HTH domain
MTAYDYLKAIRGKGLTQAQIAEKTGIPQGTISKIETGKVNDVLSATYLALQKLYGEEFPHKRRANDTAGA